MLINQHNLKPKGVAHNQGYIQALDAYLELETELNRYKQATEADKQKWQQIKDSTNVTSQAEAMGII